MIDNTQLPDDYTACEQYAGHVIAINNGLYRSFRGYGALARTRSCATRAECRKMVDKYNADEIAYHHATGAW